MLSHHETSEQLVLVAALFSALPVRRILEQHDTAVAQLLFVDDRPSLVHLVTRVRPTAVLLPPVDARGRSTATMIARLRVEAPDVPVVVVSHTSGSSRGVAWAVRSGAHVALISDADDLRVMVKSLADMGHLPPRERLAVKALLADVTPDALADILLQCVRHAHRALSVADLCRRLGMSRRTLSRRARLGGWPTPIELIEWGRLLRASVMQWRQSSSLIALARASGFANAYSLTKAARRRLGSTDIAARDLSPLHVCTALRRRLAECAQVLS